MERERSWDMLSRACPCHTLKVLCHKGVLQHKQHSTAQHSTAGLSYRQQLCKALLISSSAQHKIAHASFSCDLMKADVHRNI